MSNKSKGDAGEYEFTRAASDELQDAERKYLVKFELALLPTDQRGVWYLAVAARAMGEHEALSYCTRWQGSWPNSTSMTYGAFLYAACHRCVRMVEAWHLDRERQEASQS